METGDATPLTAGCSQPRGRGCHQLRSRCSYPRDGINPPPQMTSRDKPVKPHVKGLLAQAAARPGSLRPTLSLGTDTLEKTLLTRLSQRLAGTEQSTSFSNSAKEAAYDWLRPPIPQSETRDLEKHRPERGRHQVEDSRNEGGKLPSKDQEVTVFILQKQVAKGQHAAVLAPLCAPRTSITAAAMAWGCTCRGTDHICGDSEKHPPES